MELTESELSKVLAKFGVTRMEPMGKVFDPAFHQVVQEVEDKSKPAGTVVAELQTGYMINDRIFAGGDGYRQQVKFVLRLSDTDFTDGFFPAYVHVRHAGKFFLIIIYEQIIFLTEIYLQYTRYTCIVTISF